MNAARLWPIAIVGVLAVTVAANVGLWWAARDPSASAAEPHYYDQAVRWDSTLAERRASDALGWTVDVAIGARGRSGAEVSATVRDRDGRPLDGADVRVIAIHNREGQRWIPGTLAPAGEGRYAARLPLVRPGRWELRVRIERNGARWSDVRHAEAGGITR